MGTVIPNFPPGRNMEIGQIMTISRLGQTYPMPTQVFFTAPTTGLYQIAALLHLTQTDGIVGTQNFTMNLPGGQVRNAGPLPGPIQDLARLPRLAFCPQGSVVTCHADATGIGNTTFNFYLVVSRVF